MPPPRTEPKAAPPHPATGAADRRSAAGAGRQRRVPANAAGDDALLAAFLEGAGMQDAAVQGSGGDDAGLGKAFRDLVAGLRAVLIARAQIKSEFRIEQTMIQARGNNPLKFSAGDDDAWPRCSGPDAAPTWRRTRRWRMRCATSGCTSWRRWRRCRPRCARCSTGLDPAKLRVEAEQGGGMTLLPAQKKARAWDAYEALHARTVQALADDFDSVFGKAFARAYERALQEIAAKEPE